MPAAAVRTNRKLVHNIGLLASASLMSLTMAGEAQAACTPSTAEPLNNIATDFNYVDCNGANTGETIVVNANAVQLQINNPGDTLDNSSITINGNNSSTVIQNGGSSTALVYTAQGQGNQFIITGASANDLTYNVFGAGNQLYIAGSASVTTTPGNIVLSANPGEFNSVILAGTLQATGNNGGAYLLNGGTGDQFFNIQGTLTVQPNGLAISAGDGNDEINIGSSAVVNGGSGTIIFNGGNGTDILNISGGGASNYTGIDIELLAVVPGVGNTHVLGGTGSYSEVLVGAGTVQVADTAALGLGNSAVSIAGNGKLQLVPTAPMTFGHSLLGNGTIEQTGQTVTYNGTGSTFTGTFLLSGGTAVINSGSQFGTGSIVNNSAIQLTNITLGNTISGSGSVTKIGAGTATLGGINTYSDGTLVSAGTLRLTNGQAAGTASVAVVNGATLELDFATDQTLANEITGGGNLVKFGAGVATLTGPNSYAGGTTINAGAIRVDDFAKLGTGPVVANSGTSLILDYNGPGQLLQTTPFMTGNGSFIKEGTGDVVMNQTSTFTGGTTIRAGRIGLNNGDALGTGNIQVDAGAELGIGGITLNNTITGTGLVRKTAPNIAELYGDNSGFTGTLRVEEGIVSVTDGNAFGSGTLQIDFGASARIDTTSTSTVTVGLTGAGNFEKLGAGSVTLAGDGSLFTGGVSVLGGTVQIEGEQNIGNASVFIANGATLRLDTAGSTQLSNFIYGAGNVVKTGTGTVQITNAMQNTGGLQIQDGAIRVTDVSLLGTGAVSVFTGAFLDLSISGAQTLNLTVSGGGKLRKSDSGDLTLTGNTLTGGVDIIGGRVIVGTAGALGGGPVSMAADTQLVFDTNGTEVMSNPISGQGALTKDGTGSLIIQNANTYSGGTVINAGRIGLNNGQGLGTGDVIVMQDAVLNLGNVVVANNISGNGIVRKTASGTGSLTGTNTYSGGTDIQDGTLVVNSPAALGSGGVTIASGAVLNVNYSGAANAALANVLSGGGALVKDGTGTVVINTGGNTYSGGTTINAGRLSTNFGDGLGTGTVVIAGGAELGIGGITLANNVTGAGRIVKTGGLTATLTGSNTHTGGLDIQGGVVNVAGNAQLGSGAVIIASGAQLNFTNAGAASFSNGLSGAGTFNKLGAGQLSFANNFTIGALNLTAGSTRINSIATTNVAVSSGARLDGTGRIIGTLTNNGTVAPGNSIGTLTVQGNYVHNAGSVLEIEFDANGNIDLLNVTGNATLNGGTIRFLSIGGAEGQGGTFLTTGGALSGTFATVETVGALLPLQVVYQPTAGLMAPSVLTARPSTFNAQSLAAADTALAFADSLGVADARHGRGNRLWMTGFGAWGSRSASGTTLGYDHDVRGISGGATFEVGPNLTLEASVGWAKGDIELSDNGGGGEQSSVLGAFSLRYDGGGFSLGGGVFYGSVQQDTLRNVSFSGFSGSVRGETDSKLMGGFVAASLPIGTTGGWTFDANLSAGYVRQEQDGYTEAGTSPLRLRLGDLTTESLEGRAGLTARTSLWDGDQGGGESPEGLDLTIDLGGRFLGTLGSRELPVTFAVSTAGIVLQGDKRDLAQALFGVGLEYTARSGARFSLGYRGEAGKASRHAVQAGISFAF